MCYFKPKYFFLLLLAFPLLLMSASQAQSRPLVKVLEEMGQHYKLFFSYDFEEVKRLDVAFKINEKETKEKAIERLLNPTGLSYEQFNEQYYVIYKKRKKEKVIKRFEWEIETEESVDKVKKTNVLSGMLVDANTEAPIYNAFIFIRNSSISTTSDLSGTFQLDIKDLDEVELVITHLNYETKSIQINTTLVFPSIISLQAKNLEIAQIVVNSKRSKSRKRKKWMKRFKKGFFGNTANSKGIELLNPEMLWFQEEGKLLKAEAVDYLSIVNNALGYKLRFYLDTFQLNKKGHVFYSGKVFFEDIKEAMPDNRKIDNQRLVTHIESKKHFLQSLWTGEVDSEQITMGIAVLSKKGKLKDFQIKNVEGLEIKKSGDFAILNTSDYFAFANKNIVTEWRSSFFKGGKNSYATGFLKPRNGQIIFDRRGNIVNAYEVEEFGYWTQKRIANLLPIEYNYIPANSNTYELASNRIRQITNWSNSQLQEKVYLHLNKPYYSLRDKIWFKAYLANATDHSPNTQSSVVYVDLISPDGSIVKSWQLHKDKSMEGYFAFNNKLPGGCYQIRGYTAYMRNAGDAYFFQKNIQVFDYQEVKVNQYAPTLIAEKPNNPLLPNKRKLPLSLQFYPEGGYLVDELTSNIAFEVLDTLGQPKIIEGVIKTKNGAIITKIKTSHLGIGLFNFIPQKGKEYLAEIDYQGQIYSFPLPHSLENGYVLKVNNTNDNNLFIEFSASSKETLSDAFLIGHVRGQPFCLERDLSRGTLTIPKSSMPIGLAHFTLFDGKNLPQAERIIFNDFGLDSVGLKMAPANNYFTKRQKVAVNLSMSNKFLAPEKLNLSIAVTDKGLADFTQNPTTIKSWLWLNSDLEKDIPNLVYYWTEVDKRKRFWLDLLMMTKKWRRFKWQESAKPAEYLPELGYEISGYTTDLEETNRVAATVTLSSLKKDFYHETLETDEQGNFRFTQIPYLDSLDFILQGRQLGSVKPEEANMLNRDVTFHLTKQEKPSTKQALCGTKQLDASTQFNDYLANEKRANLIDSVFNLDWKIDLDSITVRAPVYSDSRLFGIHDLNKLDWIPPQTTALRLLTKLQARSQFELDNANGSLIKRTFVLGELVKVPVSVIINGFPANPMRIQFLEADMIDNIFIGITPPSVVINTRSNGPRSLQTRMENGILNFSHPGYHDARAFYAPDYSQPLPNPEKPDLRTAIYWSPNFKLDKNGQGTLYFYSADTPTIYEVRVEGLTASGLPISEVLEVAIR